MITHSVRRLARLAVGWYPLTWRERYAEEVLDVLDQHRVSWRTVADLMVNAAATHLDPAYRTARRLRRSLGLTAGALGTVAVLFGLFTLLTTEPTDFGLTGAHDVAYSADSRLVLTDGGDQALRLWSLADPAHPAELCQFRGGDFASLAPNGRTVATIDDSIVLWNVSDPAHPAKMATLFGKGAEAQAAEFSPDGRILASTAGDSDVLTLWDITDPAHLTVRGVLPSHQDMRMAFTGDGSTLATTEDGLVMLWNIANPASPKLTSTIDTTATRGARMGFERSAWDISDPTRPAHLHDVIRASAGPGIFQISPDGQSVVSADRPELNTINVWSIADSQTPVA